MPIPQNQILSAEIHYQGVIAAGGSNTIPINLVFHYRRTTVAVAPNKTNLKTAWYAALAAVLNNAMNATFAETLLRIRWPNDAQDMFQDFTISGVGSVTGDRMASEDAAFLLYRTNLRGKNFRGSKHLAPMSESDTTTPNEDIWNAAAYSRLQAINTALLTPLTDSDGNIWNFAILSRFLSQLKTNPTTVIINDVTQALVNKRIGSMLHRKVKSVY